MTREGTVVPCRYQGRVGGWVLSGGGVSFALPPRTADAGRHPGAGEGELARPRTEREATKATGIYRMDRMRSGNGNHTGIYKICRMRKANILSILCIPVTLIFYTASWESLVPQGLTNWHGGLGTTSRLLGVTPPLTPPPPSPSAAPRSRARSGPSRRRLRTPS